MPLTSLELSIDQRVPGWGPRARAEGGELLRRAGLGAMAAELERAGREPAALLESLARYLRLNVTPGSSPAEEPPVSLAGGGPSRCAATEAAVPQRVRLAWRHRDGSAIEGTPTVRGLQVVYGSDGGAARALDLASGQRLHDYAAGVEVRAALALTDELAVMISADGLQAVNRSDGLWRWCNKDIWNVRCTPVVADGLVFVGDAGGHHHLRCLDLASGQERWSALTLGVPSVVALSDGRVVVGTESSTIHCFDAQSGKMIWEHMFPLPITQIAVRDGRVIFGHILRVFCYSLETGEVLWETAGACGSMLHEQVAIGPSCAVATDEDGHLYCFELEDGRTRWRHNVGRVRFQFPTIAGERLLAAGSDGVLRCFDLQNGKPLWRFHAGAPITTAAEVAHDGRILFGTAHGQLICLSEETRPAHLRALENFKNLRRRLLRRVLPKSLVEAMCLD